MISIFKYQQPYLSSAILLVLEIIVLVRAMLFTLQISPALFPLFFSTIVYQEQLWSSHLYLPTLLYIARLLYLVSFISRLILFILLYLTSAQFTALGSCRRKSTNTLVTPLSFSRTLILFLLKPLSFQHRTCSEFRPSLDKLSYANNCPLYIISSI